MKSLIRNIVFFSIALFILPFIIGGFSISGGLMTVFLAGFIMALLSMFVKPLLSIITFPLSVITLGFFGVIVDVFLLYLLTVFVASIKIHAFVFTGAHFAGFIIPKMSVNTFFAFVLSALIIYTVTRTLSWLTR